MFTSSQLEGAPTLHFLGCLVSISSCSPDRQWALQGEQSSFSSSTTQMLQIRALCQDMADWGCRKARHTPALCTQETIKSSHAQHLHRQQILCVGVFLAPGALQPGGRLRMCKHNPAPGPGRSGTELGVGAARPGANTAICVRQGKTTSPDPDG